MLWFTMIFNSDQKATIPFVGFVVCLFCMTLRLDAQESDSARPSNRSTGTPATGNRATPGEVQAKQGEEVFSGPQVGEEILPFELTLALGESAGQVVDPVAIAKGGPLLLVFLHDVNRQSVSMTRVLAEYARSRSKDGLHTSVILLSDDATGAKSTLKRIEHALAKDVATGVSMDGREGPGSYGLNRTVQLTILMANKNRVTANFALIQPSLQVDLPKVAEAIVAQIGGPVPKLDQLLQNGGAMQRTDRPGQATEQEKPDPEMIRSLVRPLIQLDADKEQVDQAAEAIERAIEKSPAIQKEIGRIATTIVSSGKLENYGTLHAQGYLKRWADKYGQPPARPEDVPKKP